MVFTDAELVILSKIPELSKESIKGVKGIAQTRLRDYVEYFYVINDGETIGQSNVENNSLGESV